MNSESKNKILVKNGTRKNEKPQSRTPAQKEERNRTAAQREIEPTDQM